MTNFLTPVTVLAPTTGSNPITKTYLELGYRYVQSTTLTSGSGAFNQSASTRLLLVRVWGATGGGGGVDGQGPGTLAIGQAGGNGSSSGKWITIAPGETFTYAIGAKGIGAAAGANNGTSGGTTSFTGSVSGTVQVTGGVGGAGTLGAASGNVGQALPGVPTGGDLNVVGHRAINIRWLDGLNYSFPNNGVPLLGGSQQTTSTGDGADSLYYSAGGMGAFVTASTTNFAGGDGYSGLIIVEEWA